ncbi:restriction endonuclease subunit S [Salmonella enterica subsp. enterica]|nr:restriction endonuclease subunit S [Salmonella enterica subsp. enterica]
MGNEDFKLPPRWHCRSLVDCTKGGNISYGIVQPGQHQDDGIGIIRVNNIQNGKISVADVLKVSHDIESKFSKTRLEGGEVLLTLVGSTGLSAITTKDLHGWNVARAIAVIKPSDEISAEWIHICLQSPYTKYFLDSRANTTVQKTLNLKDVKEIPLPIPPIEERMNLEKIYFDLENKINLNLGINQTLEQMSQTLFKSWFVDFDPVIDNALDAGNPIPEALQSRAELRQKVRNGADFKPLPVDIRALFPAEFEETELGWIPEGWESETFDSFCDLIQSGGTPSRKETSFWDDGTIKWLSSGEVKGKIVLDTKEKITDAGLLNSSAKLWEKYTTVVAMYGATAGEVCIIGDKMTANQACCGLYSEKYPFYVYNFVSDKAYELASKATGSAQQNLNKLIISSTKFIRPSNAIITIFENNVAPLFMKWFSNSAENNNLTALRDTLLPKLISGELSLEDLPDLANQTEPA